MRLPTAREISPHGSLDEHVAQDHFLGKTLEEAEALFRENSLYYLEDLMWMGPKAFCFYVRAAIGYFQSSAADGDSDGLHSFYSALEFQWEHEREEIAACLAELKAAVQYLLDNWKRFDAHPTIDAELRDKYAGLLSRLES